MKELLEIIVDSRQIIVDCIADELSRVKELGYIGDPVAIRRETIHHELAKIDLAKAEIELMNYNESIKIVEESRKRTKDLQNRGY